MLKFKEKNRSLCVLQVYAPNDVSEYQTFVDDANDALQKVGSTEFTIFLFTISTYTLKQTTEHGKVWLVDMETQRLAKKVDVYCNYV